MVSCILTLHSRQLVVCDLLCGPPPPRRRGVQSSNLGSLKAEMSILCHYKPFGTKNEVGRHLEALERANLVILAPGTERHAHCTNPSLHGKTVSNRTCANKNYMTTMLGIGLPVKQ